MIRRPFTLGECIRMAQLSAAVRREGNPELASLIERLASGDDSALPAFHDELNVLGRHDLADALRKLVRE
jgi:hypothetical protein